MTRKNEQDVVENNKRDEKEKVKNKKEMDGKKPLKFAPIAYFCKKINKGIETRTNE